MINYGSVMMIMITAQLIMMTMIILATMINSDHDHLAGFGQALRSPIDQARHFSLPPNDLA